MTEKDQQLINQAFLTTEWSQVSKFEKEAETQEAKEILNDRKIFLYRKEEAFAQEL